MSRRYIWRWEVITKEVKMRMRCINKGKNSRMMRMLERFIIESMRKDNSSEKVV